MSVQYNETDLLIPAIRGKTNILTSITNILTSIATHAFAVKRVVITSSFTSIVDMNQGARPGSAESGAVAHCASKTLAEKVAWKFVEEQKPNFTLATICPPMVYGTNVHDVTSLDKFNTSAADTYRLMNWSEKSVAETSFFAYVDVRDVAETHQLAYQKVEAGGERFWVTGGSYSYQEVCNVIRRNVPEVKDRTPKANPAERVLGLKYTSLEKCITDEVRWFLELEKKTGKV